MCQGWEKNEGKEGEMKAVKGELAKNLCGGDGENRG